MGESVGHDYFAAQDIVPGRNQVERTLQRQRLDDSPEGPRTSDIERARRRIEQPEEPDRLLEERQSGRMDCRVFLPRGVRLLQRIPSAISRRLVL